VGAPFVHTLRVRYGECDAQGVVFNAHYLAYFDVAITELWRAAFGSYEAMTDRGVDIVVAEAHLRFRAPARFDQQLTLEVSIARLGQTSIVTQYVIRHDGQTLVEGSLRHVLVDLPALTKTEIPDWVRAGLEPWTVPADGAAGVEPGTVAGG
jgi:acyl-CoA thioester hydrolase